MDEQDEITRELCKMDLNFLELDYDTQYRRCCETFNKLEPSYRDYTLMELIDPITFELKWYWKKKS